MLNRLIPVLLPSGWLSTDAQAVYAYNQANVIYGGTWNPSSPLYYAWGLGNGRSGVDLYVTGTRLDLQLQSNTLNGWTLIVDGVPSVPALAAATLTTITAFQGPHRARLVQLRNPNNVTSQVKQTAFATLWGRPPSIAYPPNFGAVHNVVDTTNGVDHTAYIRPDGTLITQSPGGGYTGVLGHSNGACGSLRFKATTRSIQLWMEPGLNPIKVRLAIDDVPQAVADLIPAGTGGNWEWYAVATGLDGTAEHTYEISCATAQQLWVPWGISCDGTVNTGALAARTKTVAYYGDSICEGSGNTSACHTFAYLTSKTNGYSCRNAGLSSRTVRNVGGGVGSPGGSLSGESATAQVTAYGVSVVDILMGANDAAGLFGSTYNAGTFQTAYQNMLTAIRAGLPSAAIHVFGMLPTNAAGGYATNRASVVTATQAAVTAVGDGNTSFWSTDGVVALGTSDYQADQLHLTDTGQAKLAAFMATKF